MLKGPDGAKLFSNALGVWLFAIIHNSIVGEKLFMLCTTKQKHLEQKSPTQVRII
jgi:hypothetical protein